MFVSVKCPELFGLLRSGRVPTWLDIPDLSLKFLLMLNWYYVIYNLHSKLQLLGITHDLEVRVFFSSKPFTSRFPTKAEDKRKLTLSKAQLFTLEVVYEIWIHCGMCWKKGMKKMELKYESNDVFALLESFVIRLLNDLKWYRFYKKM